MEKLEIIGIWVRELVALAIVLSVAAALAGGIAYVGTGLAFQHGDSGQEVALATEAP